MKDFILGSIEYSKEVLKANEMNEKVSVFFKSKIKAFEGLLGGIEHPYFDDIVETARDSVKTKLAYEMNDPTYLEGKLEAFNEVLEYMKGNSK